MPGPPAEGRPTLVTRSHNPLLIDWIKVVGVEIPSGTVGSRGRVTQNGLARPIPAAHPAGMLDAGPLHDTHLPVATRWPPFAESAGAPAETLIEGHLLVTRAEDGGVPGQGLARAWSNLFGRRPGPDAAAPLGSGIVSSMGGTSRVSLRTREARRARPGRPPMLRGGAQRPWLATAWTAAAAASASR